MTRGGWRIGAERFGDAPLVHLSVCRPETPTANSPTASARVHDTWAYRCVSLPGPDPTLLLLRPPLTILAPVPCVPLAHRTPRPRLNPLISPAQPWATTSCLLSCVATNPTYDPLPISILFMQHRRANEHATGPQRRLPTPHHRRISVAGLQRAVMEAPVREATHLRQHHQGPG